MDIIGACYLDEDAPDWQRALVARIPPEGVTPAQVLACEEIPPEDRFWLLTHLLSDRDARLLACRIAAKVLRRTGVTDRIAWRAVRVAARYAVGRATVHELILGFASCKRTSPDSCAAACCACSARGAAWSAGAEDTDWRESFAELRRYL
jgi:hypothetical protein